MGETIEKKTTEEAQSRARIAIIAAGLVLASGGGAMWLIWILFAWPVDVKGFPDFKSGTVGDLVLLPLLTGCLVWLLREPPTVRRRRLWWMLAATVGVIAGAWVQYSWWADPGPVTQWGLSAPKDFSLAGWWHAIFFVLMSGLLAGLWVALLRRWHAQRGSVSGPLRASLDSWAWAGIVFTVVGFAGMVAMDSAPTISTFASISTLLTLAGATLFTVLSLAIAVGRNITSGAKKSASGALAAALLLVFCQVLPIWGN